MSQIALNALIALLLGLQFAGRPDEHSELRIDLIRPDTGFSGSIVVRRTTRNGYTLYSEHEGYETVSIGFVAAVKEDEPVYRMSEALSNPPIDLRQAIANYEQLELKQTVNATFEFSGGGERAKFKLNRSGKTLYLQQEGDPVMFCIHLEPLPPASAASGAKTGH